MKIGVSAPGSSTNRLVLHMLAKDGLKGGDVSIIGVGTASGAIAAIESGNIDAISNVDPVITMLESKGDIVLIADTRTAKGTAAVFGSPDMPAAALYAPIDFVKKNPNTVQALTNAMVRALLWLDKATPDQVVATVPPEYLLGDKAGYLASYNKVKDAFSTDGRFNKEGAENTMKVLAAFNPDGQACVDQSRADLRQPVRRKGAGQVQEISACTPPRASAGSRRSRSIASPARSHRASGRAIATRRCATRRSRSARANSSRSSGPPAAASRPCSMSRPDCWRLRRARSAS